MSSTPTTLIVDNREKVIIPLLSSIPHESANLEIGDFQIIQGDQIQLLIERKTISDLAASIVDGRYREQKKRILAQNIPKVIYLIEGSLSSYKGSIPINTLYSTVINCTLRDNIHILISSSAEESATLIIKCWKKLQEYKIDSGCKISYQEASVKQQRNKNLTPPECYLHQLAQIPGISYTTAKGIAKGFPTMTDLLDSLEADADMLVEYRVNDRRLGVKGSRVYQYLFQLE